MIGRYNIKGTQLVTHKPRTTARGIIRQDHFRHRRRRRLVAVEAVLAHVRPRERLAVVVVPETGGDHHLGAVLLEEVVRFASVEVLVHEGAVGLGPKGARAVRPVEHALQNEGGQKTASIE